MDAPEAMKDMPGARTDVPGGRAAGNGKKNHNKIILCRYYSITVLVNFHCKNYYNHDDATFVGVCTK